MQSNLHWHLILLFIFRVSCW